MVGAPKGDEGGGALFQPCLTDAQGVIAASAPVLSPQFLGEVSKSGIRRIC